MQTSSRQTIEKKQYRNNIPQKPQERHHSNNNLLDNVKICNFTGPPLHLKIWFLTRIAQKWMEGRKSNEQKKRTI